jgi:hypothetical protein
VPLRGLDALVRDLNALVRDLDAPVRGPMVAGAAGLKELSKPLCLLGAEPDDGTRLSPWFLERVTHVSDDRLARRLP